MRFALILPFIVLLACAPRGAITLDPAAAAVGDVTPVFIGTTREFDGGRFGPARSEEMRFARYDISIPPLREAGEINWPTRLARPDPRRHFLTTAEVVYGSDPAFRADLKRDLAAHGQEAVIFVHGYNNNFSEGLYRVAQFAHDLELPGTVVHYAWPSAARPLGYVYDRDSAMFARDGLEKLMDEVAAAGARRILLVAHSMGSALAMESLRQAAIRGDRATLDRLAGVILISPDIDVDLFRMQAKAIGKLPQPFLIFGSDRDKLLRLSAQLTGQSERLGSLSDVSRLADLEVTFLDVGEFGSGTGHFILGDSPALIRLIDSIGQIEGAFEADRARRIGLVSGVVLSVQNATQIVLRPVAEIAVEVNQ
ncbi:alpha/beta hydrolase [Tabrizicola oligotrophica]|uniref:Alpha/beta fold hydrolase n=1 Tax=Tabrizicola oligotrophica TaxID=2710650 RepID=A0A6M0QSA6_9RHOB|nr:alpha/beta fold hydrolase [Tabrizicola oligotrophica]NEY90318.1 alpha/beta fold hydrolase [Tabrizicola oligotrophica]